MKKALPYILIVIASLIAGGLYLEIRKETNDPNKNSFQAGNQSGDIELENYGQAPEFMGIENWLNSEPLTMSGLKGKVVLIDFWTYSCINCIRTLPYLNKWHDAYKNKGLVIVGVHTPEFPFEMVTGNVETALQRFGIKYPVAQDNQYQTWNAYSNRYWPAKYLVDKSGNVVYAHFGEGDYDETENVIRKLLGITGSVGDENGQDLSRVNSPEMYFGSARLENLSSQQAPSEEPANYKLPTKLELNEFALDGNWQFDQERAVLVSGTGKIKLRFSSAKVFFVAAADAPVTLKIWVDGKTQPEVSVSMFQLYPLFDSNDYSEHEIEIEIQGAPFGAFTFTFG